MRKQNLLSALGISSQSRPTIRIENSCPPLLYSTYNGTYAVLRQCRGPQKRTTVTTDLTEIIFSTNDEQKLDRKLIAYEPLGPTDKTKDDLRYFYEVLLPDGKRDLADDISGFADDEPLRQLVQSIETGLLIPLKAQGGKTPTEIKLSPRDGLDGSIENLKSLNIVPIDRSPQSQLRRYCLERDGNRCVATGWYDDGHDHRTQTRPNLKPLIFFRLHLDHFRPATRRQWTGMQRSG